MFNFIDSLFIMFANFLDSFGIFLFLGLVFAFVISLLLPSLLKILGVYCIVEERQARVYLLFGNVVGVLMEPGLYFLWKEFGLKALIINTLGKCYKIDLRLDQQYLRSQPVNSEEGAPMGVGLWYEMYISDPTAYLFRNTNPRGSLAANVGNSTVRCLSNLPLDRMMADRHTMSRIVRSEVSEQSQEWGYKLGSCYIRKVHFNDYNMIQEIQNKVVNRLRQVTSAIMQEGANQVKIITSTAEKEAAIDFGKASAIRPNLVGKILNTVSKDPDVCKALFEIMEVNRIVNNKIPLHIFTDKMMVTIPFENVKK